MTEDDAERNALRRETARLNEQFERSGAEGQRLRAEIKHLRQELSRSNAALAELSSAHDEVIRSTSWRITEPLRRLMRRLPRLHHYLRRPQLSRQPSALQAAASQEVAPGMPASVSPDRVLSEAGHWIHVEPDDTRAQSLIEAGGSLNPHTMMAWRLLVAEAAWTHVFDIGANYGEMLLNIFLPPGTEVIAAEPNPVIRARLAQNLAQAGIAAEILETAFSAAEGMGRLRIHETWSGMTRLAAAGDEAGLPVPVTTLGACLRRLKTPLSAVSALVKIDVEGDEADVLRGGLQELHALRSFAALAELLWVAKEDVAWIEQHFDIELLQLHPARLVRIPRGQLSDAMANDAFYRQDVVLRRRSDP